jgi:nucleoid-associated protein YgaU
LARLNPATYIRRNKLLKFIAGAGAPLEADSITKLLAAARLEQQWRPHRTALNSIASALQLDTVALSCGPMLAEECLSRLRKLEEVRELAQPWRWPELWGMNLQDIRNPHLIYPGQVLLLDKQDGRATLRLATPVIETPAEGPTIKLSPRIRVETPADSALPALKSSMIDAFLTEPVVVDDSSLQTAARIVAAQDSRVLLTRGDRAYALGSRGSPLIDDPQQPQQAYRVLRNATPLKDPVTGEVLGFEAQYIGRVLLVRGESAQTTTSADGKAVQEVIPATIDIVAAREEIRVGDRLLPEPALTLRSYVPRAPSAAMEARVVSVYGNAVANVGQNQVVVINRGSREGLESGHMLAILTDGARLIDKTDPARTALKLPDERKGLLMVFRSFERLSYALVLEATEGVRVGDRLVNPR